MKSKPWPIVILSWMYILAPIPNIFLACYLQKISLGTYLGTFVEEKMWFSLAELFLLFPAAGIAIYSFKKWSYAVFLLVSTFALYTNYRNWTDFPTHFPLHDLIMTYLLNIGIVGYFLIPAVRAAYFNPRLRWWESLPRYVVDFDAEIVAKGGVVSKGKILNVSKGGVFLRAGIEMVTGDVPQVLFQAYGISVQISCKVMHVDNGVEKGYGLQFVNLNHDKEMKNAISELIATLKRNGVEQISPRIVNKSDDFKSWVKTLFKTGKGLVPKVYQSVKNTKSETEKE